MKRVLVALCTALMAFGAFSATAMANDSGGNAVAQVSGVTGGAAGTLWFKNLNNAPGTYITDQVEVADGYGDAISAGVIRGSAWGETFTNPTYFIANTSGEHLTYGTAAWQSSSNVSISCVLGAGASCNSFDVYIDQADGQVDNVNDSTVIGHPTLVSVGGFTNSDSSATTMCEHDSGLGYFDQNDGWHAGLQSLSTFGAPRNNWITQNTNERAYENEASNC